MTLTELAKLAHVSTSTASKAFAGSPEVNEQTREMIFEAAKRAGCFKKFYKSDYPGYVIAVICPEFTSTYYSGFIAKMQECLARYNSEMCVMATGFSRETEEKLIEYYDKYNTVDGIIVINGISELPESRRIPIANVSRFAEGRGDIEVTMNLTSPIEELVSELCERGARSFGFVGDKYAPHRLERYRRILEKHGIDVPDMAVAISEDKRFEPCGRAGVDEILSDGNPPRVIFCSYDRIAYGAIRELLDRGYRVPEDVAVFSVDDAPSSEYFKPSLTSVNHAVDETCEAVSTAIIKKIKGEPFAEEIRIVCPLSRRESTDI